MDDFSLQSLRAHRERRRTQRGARQKTMLVAFGIGVVLLVGAMELGRAFRQMQQVNRFVSTLSVKSPADVKVQLDQLSPLLLDQNPLVRNAAAAAFIAATGLQMEGGSGEWWQWWQDQRATWRYSTTPATNDPGLVSPQPYRAAFPQRR